mmetsp:Transcript_81906/g.264388  ORF Transcript_81906/g.264388 Transcript_81906/m.264388 type:complete len:260 (-) Transcript_81906:528-1307(-)
MRHARQALIACHLHLLGIRLAVLVVSILILVLALGLRRLRLLGLVLLLLLGRLHLAQGLPLLREDIRLGLVVSDDDVVEDAAALDLPEVEADEAEVCIRVERLLIHVLRVRDLLRLPKALVARIRDALHGPVALVLRIVLRGRLPLAVLLIVPVVRLLGISVHHALLLHPIGGLLVLRIIHHGVIHPIARFFCRQGRRSPWPRASPSPPSGSPRRFSPHRSPRLPCCPASPPTCRGAKCPRPPVCRRGPTSSERSCPCS